MATRADVWFPSGGQRCAGWLYLPMGLTGKAPCVVMAHGTTGTCAVNSGIVVEPRSPFGGFKQSGVGRELGREGLEAYLETRTVVLPLG